MTGVQLEGDLVAHRPRRNEQARLPAQQGRDPALQIRNGGVLSEYVVADDGGRHGSAHPCGGTGHCIRAEVYGPRRGHRGLSYRMPSATPTTDILSCNTNGL